MRCFRDSYTIPTPIAMLKTLRIPFSTHPTLVAMEYFIDCFGVILVKLAFQTGVLPENSGTLDALIRGFLLLLAALAFDFSDILKLHPLCLAPISFGSFVQSIVAKLAPIEYLAARSFNLA